MLQNLLASMGALVIVVVTFARMLQRPRGPLRQPAKSASTSSVGADRSRPPPAPIRPPDWNFDLHQNGAKRHR
ncbi:hypothetical protein [Bradyrhizobium embrapense]|uniref:hypothetical protein n=1 Tax=Bradyrhizobium embrapense TaxID=630921 RepID=UPI000AE8358E|nr:hypothetical protein [Bradyrhizobium embrapense]